ncbi:MAG: low molecular weight phosphatase family protein [Oscillochloris sp.]|nr:low molecular weight phosphatase family protein [Oscillochloris sp.]
MPHILVVGAADTGRAPITAALLRRMLAADHPDWHVDSVGVVGHDGDPAEPEARNAMAVLGIDLDDHVARTISDTLAANADLLLAMDSGIVRVLQARNTTAPLLTLGALAGKQRDIPDPFRMQVGAWLTYSREIESLLRAGLPRLYELLAAAPASGPIVIPATAAEPAPEPPPVTAPIAALRSEAVQRVLRLFDVIADFPAAVDWNGACNQLTTALQTIAAASTTDLGKAYVAMLQALLGLSAGTPNQAQLALLRGAFARLLRPIGQPEIDTLSAELPLYATLQ